MRAWVLHGIGDLRLETVKPPRPGSGEVLVSVKAAGICGSDIPRIFDTGAHVHPLIPGHEFAGVVEDLGQGVDPAWRKKRVGIFPLLPCQKCLPCERGAYELCRSYRYLGSRCNGGFAEYVAVPAWNLVELPKNVSFEEAAMLEPMAVAVHALRRGTEELTLDMDAPVAVCGLGPIGLLLVMFLLEAGYRNLYAVGKKESQKARAVSMGILPDHYLDSRTSRPEECLKSCGDGMAIFFECTGRSHVTAMGVECARPAGRVVLVGNPCSHVAFEKEIYWRILRNQLTVIGTWNSSFAGEGENDWDYVLERLETGCIAPAGLISHRFSLERLREGLAVMREKKEDSCKIMIEMNGEPCISFPERESFPSDCFYFPAEDGILKDKCEER